MPDDPATESLTPKQWADFLAKVEVRLAQLDADLDEREDLAFYLERQGR